MAKTFIKLDRNATDASLLLQYISSMRQSYNLGLQIRAIMSNNNDGVDFSPLEALFGIPAGQGQAVFDLVNGSVGAMEGTFQNPNSKNLTETMG